MTTPLTPRETLAATVRAEAARRSVRQREIAAALGLDQRAVSRRLLGYVEWSGTELQQLAALLEVPVATLLSEPAAAAS